MDAIFGGNTAAHDAALMDSVQQDVAQQEIPGLSKTPNNNV